MRPFSLGRIRISPKRIAIRLPRGLFVYCVIISVLLVLQLVVRGATSMVLALSLLYALADYDRDTVIIDARKREILIRRRNAGYTVYEFAHATAIVERFEKMGLKSYALSVTVAGEESFIPLTPPLPPYQTQSKEVKELLTAIERMVFSSAV